MWFIVIPECNSKTRSSKDSKITVGEWFALFLHAVGRRRCLRQKTCLPVPAEPEADHMWSPSNGFL